MRKRKTVLDRFHYILRTNVLVEKFVRCGALYEKESKAAVLESTGGGKGDSRMGPMTAPGQPPPPPISLSMRPG